MSAKSLATYGSKRSRGYVRVWRDTIRGRPLVRVRWVEGGQRRTESFPDSRNGIREAKAFARGTHERLTSQPSAVPSAPRALRELHEQYVTAKADAWRPQTLRLHNERWHKFELFAGRSTLAGDLTRERLDEYKRALLANKHAVNQVRAHIETVTAVYRWAIDRDLVPPTKVATYKPEFSRDARREQTTVMAEYSATERDQLLAQWDPRDSRQWRPWALTVLLAYCGPRQRAARHLEWRDVDLERGLIHWRPELDKMGTDRWQPIPTPVLEALWVAYGWRCWADYRGAFVFFGVQERTQRDGKPWTYQAYAKALHAAEDAAGVATKKYRAAHGFRRGIAGDVFARTGSEKRAAEWIGDKSVKIVRDKYLLEREEELRKTAALVSKGSAMATNDNPSAPDAPESEVTGE